MFCAVIPANSDRSKISLSNSLPLIAVVISLVALMFTALQWRESHNLLLLSMRPSVDLEIAEDTEDLPVGIDIQNSGPGPAIIKSITYYSDKKFIGDIDKLSSYTDLSGVSTYDIEEGDTIAVGERHFLVSIKSKPNGKDEQKTMDDFIELIHGHLAVEVRFCPVLPGDCYTKCSTKGWCSAAQ
jgi:hypothetical protein